MPVNVELVLAGLAVGFLIGSTGMGAGSLMAPILITLFNVNAVAAVGTDLLYSAGTKLVGGVRHLQLNTVHRELGLYMALGSVPASVAGVYTLHRLAASRGAEVQNDLKKVIAWALILVAAAVAVRTFVTLRAVYTDNMPKDGPLNRRHRVLAIGIGLIFGFVFGLTSVGAGAFFGMSLLLLFPLSTLRVVGTDLFHGAIVTIAAAIAAWLFLPALQLTSIGFLMLGSVPGILVGAQVAVRLPEKALRGSLSAVLAFSGLKLLGLLG
jgi:uncharacterized protein